MLIAKRLLSYGLAAILGLASCDISRPTGPICIGSPDDPPGTPPRCSGGGPPTPPVPVASVTIDPPVDSVSPGRAVILRVVPRDAQGNVLQFRAATVTADLPGLALVHSSGGDRVGVTVVAIAGLAPGVVRLTATVEGRAGSAIVVITGTRASFVQVDAGFGTTCALTATHEPSCWGVMPGPYSVRTAFPIALTGAGVLSELSAGSNAACGLDSGGAVLCWSYALGERVVIPVPPLRAISVGAGWKDACGITAEEDRLVCWATNSTPIAAVALADSIQFATVSAGPTHSCAVSRTGAAHCWGSNSSGELGTGDSTSRSEPAMVVGGLLFTAIGAGHGHSCGLTEEQLVYCWGAAGWLGTGSAGGSPVPIRVSGERSYVAIAVGDRHTCAIAADGTAYCWGFGAHGALGTGRTTDELAPVQVAGNIRFRAISAKGPHTCAISVQGSAYCWGANGGAELGSGSSTTAGLTPIRVVGQE